MKVQINNGEGRRAFFAFENTEILFELEISAEIFAQEAFGRNVFKG